MEHPGYHDMKGWKEDKQVTTVLLDLVMYTSNVVFGRNDDTERFILEDGNSSNFYICL